MRRRRPATTQDSDTDSPSTGTLGTRERGENGAGSLRHTLSAASEDWQGISRNDLEAYGDADGAEPVRFWA